MEGNGKDEEPPPVESAREHASTSSLFRSTPGESRRRIIPDVYLRRVHGSWPEHVRDQSPSRIRVRGSEVHESGYYAMRYATRIPVCLNGCFCAESHSRAIFRTLPHDMPNVRSSRFHTNVRKFTSRNLYTRNWERATLKFMLLLRAKYILECGVRFVFKNYREEANY